MSELTRALRRNTAIAASGLATAAFFGALGYEASAGEALPIMNDGAIAEKCAADAEILAIGDKVPESCGKLVLRGVDHEVIQNPLVVSQSAKQQAESHYASAGDIREAEMDTEMDVGVGIWILFVLVGKYGSPARTPRTNER